MVSTWNSGLTLQTSYGAAENGKDLARYSELTFKDFLPKCRDPGGFLKSPVYETFETLVDRANDWLRKNRNWKITTCESVEFKVKGGHVNSSKMTYLEYDEFSTLHIRGLRLWLTNRSDENDMEQQIGFVNLTPLQVEAGGIFNSPVYETLDDLLSRFNNMMQSNPLPGRVITVESQKIRKSGILENRFLFEIRIFYEIMSGSAEKIGIKDFVPKSLNNGGIFSFPDYEPFSNVVKKASDWCSRQNGLRFCNAQSLEIKMRTGKDIDTKKMDYKLSGSITTYYLRILRIAYTKPSAFMKLQKEISPLISQLSCKTFVPVQLKSMWGVPEYETFFQTKVRLSAWIRATGVTVVSAETVAVRMKIGDEAKHFSEDSFTCKQAENYSGDRPPKRNEYCIFVIRVYLNGHYKEPPQEMLPFVPEIENPNCCIIS